MAISSHAAAKVICEQGGWRVTNLALQKILYIAHMVHLGRSGARLINAQFEAWDYGPVIPELYHRVKVFGDRPVQNVFYSARDVSHTEEGRTLQEAGQHFLAKQPGELVAMTHWKDGAWARNYRPGVRGIIIPDSDIVNEYRARTAAN